MKTIKITLLTVLTGLLFSCNGGMSSQPSNAKAFAEIEKDLRSQFGENAYYTDLSVSYNKQIGVIMSATVTDKPESLKMGAWTMSQNAWKQTSEITLEIPEGSKASDFMYQLKGDFSLSQMGELVEKSIEKLEKEKGLKKPSLSLASIMFPDNGDVSKAKYSIQLEPENGGTSFNYYYKMNGEFIEMDY